MSGDTDGVETERWKMALGPFYETAGTTEAASI